MSQPNGTSPSLWLEGHHAPVPDEIDAVGLPVEGTLPPELTGRYFRNGPNPLPGTPSAHWFTGPGMVHGVRLRDGRAEWYRNRWVRTTKFTDGAPFVRPDSTFDHAAVPANTHVVPHAGRILALVETGLPYELTPELDTVGPCDFGGLLKGGMTAHPKEDPVTGELLFFGYGLVPPYLTYHRLSAGGRLVESREVEVPGPTMMHDFAVTANHVVWLDLPVVFDIGLARSGAGMPFRWDDAYGARLGVMPRAGGPVRWFDVDPCYVFHVGNAYEDEAGRVVVDGVRYRPEDFTAFWPSIGGEGDTSAATVANAPSRAAATGSSRLHRWTLDPASGAVKEEPLDDRPVEFPTHDDARTGHAHRYLYTAAADAIVKHDLRSGSSAALELGPDLVPGEAVFVAAEGARAEDEGWLLSIVTDRAGQGSELLVLDAGDLSRTASVRLPRRVPAGFHGSWIPDPAS
ncbi:carotenoid oxygenase family protein [Nonomuraea roseoviolacea]|uniref:Dioxygenase n=1 Tax=Nonomuraea roseoviolacea subsp. carminata TaxID=160689 RepID=A0ABT1KAS5_9ACTN|nr:carotenoid oxygenase family protein [Nonomuraea roseoviolacea]MCP2351123.1 carotenoid cleavage dioxygenase [Nonomuraea roseoviolacea subsp. carminata]